VIESIHFSFSDIDRSITLTSQFGILQYVRVNHEIVSRQSRAVQAGMSIVGYTFS